MILKKIMSACPSCYVKARFSTKSKQALVFLSSAIKKANPSVCKCVPYSKYPWEISFSNLHSARTGIRDLTWSSGLEFPSCGKTPVRKHTFPLFQASAAMLMTSVVFWVITRRRVVIIYRRFSRFISHPAATVHIVTLYPPLSQPICCPTSHVPPPRYAAKFLSWLSFLLLGILTREDGTDTLSRNVGK
jgi:hypothetical protein